MSERDLPKIDRRTFLRITGAAVLTGGLFACGKKEALTGNQVLPSLQEPFPTLQAEKTFDGGKVAVVKIIEAIKDDGQLDCYTVGVSFPPHITGVTSEQILGRLREIHEVERHEVPPLRAASQEERRTCWQQTGIANQPCFVLDLSK